MLSLATNFTLFPPSSTRTRFPSTRLHSGTRSIKTQPHKWVLPTLLSTVALTLVGPAIAADSYSLPPPLLLFYEPPNALSLPTWAIHVSSVVEWVIAMALVWQYGDKPGNESWKGLSWGMVPLLGGAFCACTWHFFYNAESLEVLVALQAALTVLGNATMCIAAFRIYKARNSSKNV